MGYGSVPWRVKSLSGWREPPSRCCDRLGGKGGHLSLICSSLNTAQFHWNDTNSLMELQHISKLNTWETKYCVPLNDHHPWSWIWWLELAPVESKMMIYASQIGSVSTKFIWGNQKKQPRNFGLNCCSKSTNPVFWFGKCLENGNLFYSSNYTLVFQVLYLETSSQLPIYQVTIDPWFQRYM